MDHHVEYFIYYITFYHQQKELPQKKNDKVFHQKFTVLDSINSFIIVGQTVDELDKLLQKKVNGKKAIQPIIMITGSIINPIDIFVCVDGIRYRIHSFLYAVEICFKLFHIFNIEYPSECTLIWTFRNLLF